MNSAAKRIVGVVGAGEAFGDLYETAKEVGRGIARLGAVLVCGGRTGVMEAAAKGAYEEGGLTVGILPGPSSREANPYIVIALPTNMGIARNALIAQASQVVVAIGGTTGTISEVAMALKLGKPVAGLMNDFKVKGMVEVATIQEAVDFIQRHIS